MGWERESESESESEGGGGGERERVSARAVGGAGEWVNQLTSAAWLFETRQSQVGFYCRMQGPWLAMTVQSASVSVCIVCMSICQFCQFCQFCQLRRLSVCQFISV